jgi:hypothetical protein
MKPSGCPGSKMQETLMVGRVMVQVPNEAVGWPASKMQETLMVGRVMVQVPTILVVLLPHIVSIRYMIHVTTLQQQIEQLSKDSYSFLSAHYDRGLTSFFL